MLTKIKSRSIITTHLTTEVVNGINYGELFCDYKVIHMGVAYTHFVNIQGFDVPVKLIKQFWHCVMVVRRVNPDGTETVVSEFTSIPLTINSLSATKIIKLAAKAKMVNEDFDAFMETDSIVMSIRSHDLDSVATKEFKKFGGLVIDQAAITFDSSRR